MMKFCPKCKSIMMPKKEEGKVRLVCSCGHSESAAGAGSISDGKKEVSPDVDVVESEVETLPVTDADCPDCGNDRAYYWLQQTRAGDEAETRFLKCTKCKKTWREYD